MTHQGWVPGDPSDTYLPNLRVAVDRRPNTDVVTNASITSIEDLIGLLNVAGTRPIDDLIVGGHANRRGLWLMSPKTGIGLIDWEELDEFVTTGTNPIKLPDVLIDYDPGPDPANPAPPTRTFRIKGCSIGKARKFLEKLQVALGGHVKVNAPKHEHGISFNGSAGASTAAYFEWMAYEFLVFQKTEITKMKDLVDAFYNKAYEFLDGTRIPRATFASWMKPWRSKVRKQGYHPLKRNLPLGTTLGGRKTTKGQIAYYMDTPRSYPLVPFTVPYGSATAPSSTAARLADLDTALKVDPAFKPSHAWPIYERLGYPDYDALFNGLVWSFTTGIDPTLGNVLRASGGRFEYEIHIPIAQVGTNMNPTVAQLIFNHLPDSGSPAVTDGVPETPTANNFFFETVP